MKKRHKRLLALLAAMALLLSVAIVTISVFSIQRVVSSDREQTVTGAAKLAAGFIDGDKVDGWLENGVDGAYAETAGRLSNVLYNTPFLQYLYVYQIKPDGCHVVFDFDTPDEMLAYDAISDLAANGIGEVVDFDESFYEYLPTLFAGGNIDLIESNDSFGWLITKYEPVYDSEGNCVAYVGADISMVGVREQILRIALGIVLASVLFLVGCVLIGSRLSINLRHAEEIENILNQQKRDRQLMREITEAFARVIDLKDSYTQGHSFRVANYTAMLAKELGYDDDTIEQYYNIALLHDIGKIGIPDEILNKPGKLTDQEFAVIQSHTSRGYEALKDISLMPEIATGAQSHHERPDGKGYPNGLVGEDIPRIAQIIAVADCFDAMYSDRPYRKRMNFDKVISIMKEVSGTQLMPDVVDAFLRLVEKGKFRAPDDSGGGTFETIDNIRQGGLK